MLEIIGFCLASTVPNILAKEQTNLEKIEPLSWQEADIFVLPKATDSQVESIVTEYIQDLTALGISAKNQGVWLQSDWTSLGNYRGKVPISAASLTKVATTLGALEKWGASHQFETLVYAAGSVKNGVLQGDLVVRGSGDPLFVWEEAIALGNALNKLGIRQVTGNLVIVDNFYMNFKSNPAVAGSFLKVGLNSRLWSRAIRKQHVNMGGNVPQPQLAISGTVSVQNTIPANAQLLLSHKSLTLAQILKQMNIYSNNYVAQMLADSAGGARIVSKIAADAAKVPPIEIQLINGSGLGVDNRISPRAVCAMLSTIDRNLKSESLRVTDLFPVSGRDRHGTMVGRHIPSGMAVKTGTLARVSALAGVIPTKERGLVCFAIINQGSNVDLFRSKQDSFLQRLSHHWQVIPSFARNNSLKNSYFGDSSRNIPIIESQI